MIAYAALSGVRLFCKTANLWVDTVNFTASATRSTFFSFFFYVNHTNGRRLRKLLVIKFYGVQRFKPWAGR